MDNKTRDVVNGTAGLFKAIPMDTFVLDGSKMHSAYECAKRGFMVVTYGGTVIDRISDDLFRIIDRHYGVDIEAFCQTFHKSYSHVADMSPEQYFMEQLAHYFTTYGAESFGLRMIPYVPTEVLEIPETQFNVEKLVVITAMEGYQIVDLINDYLRKTAAPSKAALDLITPLLVHATLTPDEVKSFELQTIMCDMNGIVPNTPLNALRYLIYKVTGSTLVIKNKRAIDTIKYALDNSSKADIALNILYRLPPETWAQIFFRYKPLFLAFKNGGRKHAAYINKIRRAADTCHRPLNDVCLQNVTKLLSEGRIEEVDAILEKASNRELVKVGNVLGFHLGSPDNTPCVFNIRNGRTFVKTNAEHDNPNLDNNYHNTLIKISNILCSRLSKVFAGKKFYLPSYIDYTVPTSEKQMTGNYPWGTRVYCPEKYGFTAGIQWYNQQGHRVDIDLHMHSPTNHYGWNSGYRNRNNSVVYTGDQTSAPLPNGAAEGYWFEDIDDNYILSAHLFSGPSDTEFKFAVTAQHPDNFYDNFTFSDPVFAPIPMAFNGAGRGMTLGLFSGRKFFIYGGGIAEGIVPSGNYADYIKGLTEKLENQWTLYEFISEFGGTIYEELPTNLTDEERAEIIDLSPEALTITTLFDIVDGNI